MMVSQRIKLALNLNKMVHSKFSLLDLNMYY